MKVHKNYGGKPMVSSIGQSVAEMKSFLSHLGCAACQDNIGQTDEALENQERALGHLERAILDFCKDIVASIFNKEFVRNRKLFATGHIKLVKEYLSIRQEEHDYIGGKTDPHIYVSYLEFAVNLEKKFLYFR